MDKATQTSIDSVQLHLRHLQAESDLRAMDNSSSERDQILRAKEEHLVEGEHYSSTLHQGNAGSCSTVRSQGKDERAVHDGQSDTRHHSRVRRVSRARDQGASDCASHRRRLDCGRTRRRTNRNHNCARDDCRDQSRSLEGVQPTQAGGAMVSANALPELTLTTTDHRRASRA